MTRRAFEKLAHQALAGLPGQFRRRIENVALIIKDEPDRADLKTAGVRKGGLYGLYEGTPLTERVHDSEPVLPDCITLFQGPLERDFPAREALVEEIRRTVLHEVGHFFGLSERDLRRAGYE